MSSRSFVGLRVELVDDVGTVAMDANSRPYVAVAKAGLVGTVIAGERGGWLVVHIPGLPLLAVELEEEDHGE